MPNCRVCSRHYTYDDEHGYDKQICSPLCDGLEQGRKLGVRDLADALRTYFNTVFAGDYPEHTELTANLIGIVDETAKEVNARA